MNQRLLSFVLLAAAAALVATCNKTAPREDAAVAARTLRVNIAPVLRDTIPLPLYIPGKLSAAVELRLGFKTGGIIREITATEGATIPRGTRIARLDTIEFVAWREKALTALDKASRDCARVEKLFKDSVATLEQLQNARSALRAARSDADIAAFNLSQAVLTAPATGKVLKRLAEKNEVVGPGMPVVIFASTEGSWVVKAAIPDRDLAVIATGDSAVVSFDAVPGRHFTAELTGIAGAAHPVTGTFEIDLTLGETARQFRSGLVADVRLYPAARRKYAFIPASALAEGNADSALVYAVCPGDSFKAVSIAVERIFGDFAVVRSGLDGIDTVVTTGAPYLRYASEKIVIARNRERASCSR